MNNIYLMIMPHGESHDYKESKDIPITLSVIWPFIPQIGSVITYDDNDDRYIDMIVEKINYVIKEQTHYITVYTNPQESHRKY